MKNQDTASYDVFTPKSYKFFYTRRFPRKFALSKRRPGEITLYCKYRLTKDMSARSKLVALFMNDIKKTANDKFYRSYQHQRLSVEDVLSEAVIGFLKGLEKFRFDRYPGIWTICIQYIRNHMDDFIMDNINPLRKMSSSSHSRRLYFMYGKSIKKFGFEEPLTEDQKSIISTDLKLSYNQIDFMTNRSSMMVMQNIDDVGNVSAASYTEDYDVKIECERLVKKINEIRPLLSPKELVVLDKRMLQDDQATCAVLSKELDISVSKIYQIERSIKAMLSERMSK